MREQYQLTWLYIRAGFSLPAKVPFSLICASDSTYDHENHPNQYKNSHKQCDEMGHPIVNMMGCLWKLRQQHDQKFPKWRESHCRTNASIRKKRKKSK